MPESEGFIVKNNVESTVADNPLTAGATTLNVAAGQGSRFPSSFPFRMTLWDDVTYPDPTDDSGMEIVECTARTTDALTIARGKEGTSGVGHANSERVAMLITAGIFDDPAYGIITKLNGIEDNATTDQTKADIDALGIDADKVDGYHAGNSAGQVAVSNGTTCDTLNAHMLNSKYSGNTSGYIWEIMAGLTHGDVIYAGSGGVLTRLPAGTGGYTLTTLGAAANPSWQPPYSHPTARACSTGNWAWASISGKPSTYPPSAHNQSATTITSGTLPVARGGTGVTGDTYDADMVDGYHAGNSAGQVAVSNGTTCDTLNAHMLNSKYSGNTSGYIWEIMAGLTHGDVIYAGSGGVLTRLPAGTGGYTLTTLGAAANPSWQPPYSHPTARACSTGNWAWASISGKPSTYPPSAHNQSATTITSGTLPVARGGTGVTGDTYDADMVDGCHAGNAENNVFKINPAVPTFSIYYKHPSLLSDVAPGTEGYQLTTHSTSSAPTWAAASDLIFSDTHCPKCGLEFQDGDNLILHMIGHNEVGDILTIPMHQSCAAEPKKTVTIKRKVMEDQYIFDELTGEPKVQRVRKTQEKIVTKKRMKEDVELDNKTGDFWQLEDGKRKKKITSAEATEEFEEIIGEVEYEDIEYAI